MEIERANSLYRHYVFRGPRLPRSGKSDAVGETRFRADQLFAGGSTGAATHPAACAGTSHGRAHQSSIWRRRRVEIDRVETVAGVGGRVRLSLVAPIFIEMDRGASGGHMRDPGD